MNAHDRHARRKRYDAAFAIDVWENEGGAQCRATAEHHYGRRIETDRSWTVYHVFTGVPACIDDIAMVGLSQRAATDGMLSLNRRSEARRRDGGSQTPAIRTPTDTAEESRR
jgi:hypothetical protein